MLAISVCFDLIRRVVGGSAALAARALRLALGVLGVMAALCAFSPSARAAEAPAPSKSSTSAGEEPAAAPEAPMCDPAGASVVARPEVPAARSGKLEPLPCDALVSALELWLSGPHSKVPAVGLDEREPSQPNPSLWSSGRVEAAPLPAPIALFDSPLSHVLAPEGDGLSGSRGHARGPYRPPLARS